MALRDAFFLGLVQGIAEWLPVSSSGHLIILHNLFGLEGGISFDIFLHLSSLIVIIIFFHKDINEIIKAILRQDKDSVNFKWALYIIYGSVITVIMGIFIKPYLKLITPTYLPYTFFLTSIVLFLSVKKGTQEMNMRSALLVGFFQGIALLPGVSRSGITISAAKIGGVKDDEAFRFSFLLAIPAILGAVVYDIKEIDKIPFIFLLTGFLVSFLAGIGSLYLLKQIIVKRRLYLFGFYTFILSLILFFTG